MAFAPSSTVYVCNVDFDNTYKNVRYFGSATARDSFLMGKAIKTYSNYLTVRTHRPDGGFQSSIKVEDNIDDLQGVGANYLIYQNANHGSRRFYAFIMEFRYINENTTEIVFETDVYQTWIHDVTIMPSYVVREHSVTDGWKDNLVPEQFDASDFVYERLDTVDYLENWGYLLASTETLSEGAERGKLYSGVYQGLYFYYFTNIEALNGVITDLEEQGLDSIVFISLIPTFNMGMMSIGERGLLGGSTAPHSVTIDVPFAETQTKFGNYAPVNAKMGMYPYHCLTVSNHAGDEAEYKPEDFGSLSSISFKLYGDVSAAPSLVLTPLNYKGVDNFYDAGITISGFPQCSFNSDTFKLWLAKNQFSQPMGYISGALQIAGGIAATVATSGVGAAVGGGAAIVSGAATIANTANSRYQASKEPNRGQSGNTRNNLLTAMKHNKFHFYSRKIREDRARMIDEYFTMFGYQTNRVKVPNMSSRPAFNYVQTVNINISGGIPNDDMQRLKRIFNEGVTLWKSAVAVGNYGVQNRPS